jgi:ADP-L-glycero-D-manno-heptose 6-epimerase
MIVITGAAGFIGSNFAGKISSLGIDQLVLVDKFVSVIKNKNLTDKKFLAWIDRDDFMEWLAANHKNVDILFHLGARTDTTEFDKSVFEKLNTGYTKNVWNSCVKYNLPLVYASSAATYGMGELGYRDDHEIIPRLKPLNPYGESKNDFDKWALLQKDTPPYWAGLKFFNVYGPNEYHKGRMASVVLHAFDQIKQTGKLELFRSHIPGIADGEQKRDFIYVKDVVNVLLFFLQKRPASGIYNLGTGKARTFLDLANSTFKSMDRKPNIEFIDTPLDIRDKYQYFTEAPMDKLINAGYTAKFYSLEEGIDDYVRKYLVVGVYN